MRASGIDDNAAPPGTVGDALERVFQALESSDAFYGHGTDNAWDEAVQLLLFVLELPADTDAALLAEPLPAEAWQSLQALLSVRLTTRQPLPYLTGRAYFAGLEFRCDRRALVPRSPLAELILDGYAPWWTGPAPRRILDLCCGGGSIGIAAAHYDADARVVLADIDGDALALARENVVLHGLEARVQCLASDLFDALAPGPFDLILCNPPYVDAGDIATMPAEYGAEPLHALAAGEDGLDLALRILVDAADWLSEPGLLILELGNSWAALDALCPSLGLTWAEFSEGGHGVLVMEREVLLAGRPIFQRLAVERDQRRV